MEVTETLNLAYQLTHESGCQVEVNLLDYHSEGKLVGHKLVIEVADDRGKAPPITARFPPLPQPSIEAIIAELVSEIVLIDLDEAGPDHEGP